MLLNTNINDKYNRVDKFFQWIHTRINIYLADINKKIRSKYQKNRCRCDNAIQDGLPKGVSEKQWPVQFGFHKSSGR